jgi:hypothetical protein
MLLAYEAEIAYRRETMMRTFAGARLPARRRRAASSDGRMVRTLRRRVVPRRTALAPQG